MKIKKTCIFKNEYKNHWMIWEGRALSIYDQYVMLDMNNDGDKEIMVTFSDDVFIDNIQKGDSITAKFVMRFQVGCSYSFTGYNAKIIKWQR